MNSFGLLFISILPVVVIAIFLYKKDIRKESPELLTKLFIGGFGSAIMVMIISLIIKPLFPILSETDVELDMLSLLFNVFIGVALVEELCKWIVLYKTSYNHEEFDEFYDMIIYAVFVSLGFAAIENVIYVSQLGFETGIYRAIFAVPGHASDGVFMGYYLGLAKINELNGRQKEKQKNIYLSILVPTILHGIYDFCLFSNEGILLVIFFIFIIFLYIFTFKKIAKISSIKRKMKYKNNFCSNCGRKVDSNFCPNCGHKND